MGEDAATGFPDRAVSEKNWSSGLPDARITGIKRSPESRGNSPYALIGGRRHSHRVSSSNPGIIFGKPGQFHRYLDLSSMRRLSPVEF
eukprot:2634253-Pleurochrysis_carterae.AAC.2